MWKLKIFLVLILLSALLATPAVAMASSGQGASAADGQDCMPAIGQEDSVIFGSDCTLFSGQTMPRSLVVFGGNVTVEAGAVIQKDLVVFGGSVMMDGHINGIVFTLGGNITLGPNAVVEGDVVSPGGNITQDPAAQILGNRVSDVGPFSTGDGFDWASWTVGSVIWSIFQALAMSAVAVLIALFAPDYMRRTAGTLIKRPLESGGLGLLSFILLPFVLIITIITCIGPLLIALVAVLALALGWVALGYELGRRMAHSFNQDWTIVLEAWVGTLTLGVGASIIGIIPCIGFLVPIVLGALGLGAVLLTRFGTLGEPVPAIGSKPAVRPARRTVRRTSSGKK